MNEWPNIYKRTILAMLDDAATTRDNIAWVYARMIEAMTNEVSEVKDVNQAIMVRWSKNALEYIKRKARSEANKEQRDE
jgi:hypothetical protein